MCIALLQLLSEYQFQLQWEYFLKNDFISSRLVLGPVLLTSFLLGSESTLSDPESAVVPLFRYNQCTHLPFYRTLWHQSQFLISQLLFWHLLQFSCQLRWGLKIFACEQMSILQSLCQCICSYSNIILHHSYYHSYKQQHQMPRKLPASR